MKRKEQQFIEDCRFGYLEDVKKALDAGADINVCDSDGWSPLHIVCLHGYTDLVRLLIEHGADVNARTTNGWVHTPLHIACRYSDIPIVRLLLEKGADVNARNKENKSPLDMVMGRMHYDPVREQILDLFREFHPDLVMEAWCTMEVKP